MEETPLNRSQFSKRFKQKGFGTVTGILEELITSLNLDANVRDVRLGLFHTAVLTRNCGLAATLPRDALKQERPAVKDPGSLLSRSAGELVRMAYSETILEAAIGMATLNSLLEIDDEGGHNLNARDLIAEKGKGKKVAIIGHFPFIPELRKVTEELWVSEKNPKEGDLSESEAEDFVPEADVVGITGTAFTNHTIEHLLKICRSQAYVVVLGDSAPLSPILFDYGIDAVSGTKVVDPGLAMRCVSEGANYRQIRGIRRITIMRQKKIS